MNKENITMYNLINKMNEISSDKTCFVFKEDNTRYTYKEFINKVEECAKGLISMGVTKGDHIGLWMDSIKEWYILFFAANMIGAKVVPINSSFKEVEMNNIIRDFDIDFLFMTEGYKKDHIATIEPIVKNKDIKMITIGFNNPKYISYTDMIKDGYTICNNTLTNYTNNTYSNDICIVLPTSGTTGFPKGVELSNVQIIKNGFDIGERYGLTSGDNMMIQVPMFHCFGITLSMTAALTHSTCMTVIPHFNPEQALKTIEEEHITCFNGVPTMYQKMMASPKFSETDISSVTKGIMAGSNCLPQVIDEVEDKFNMTIISVYGLSEASPGCTMSSIDDSPYVRRYTVGKVLPDIECIVVDPITGHEVKPGEIGEIMVRGYNVMRGYYNNTNATKSAIEEDGYLHTGDLGSVDEYGNFYITGRKKDVIIVGGENVYPKEVEMIISNIPGVYQVSVFGVPDDYYGNAVVACIQAEDFLDEEYIRSNMKGKCSSSKIPKYIQMNSEFITNGAGKILIHEMRNRFLNA